MTIRRSREVSQEQLLNLWDACAKWIEMEAPTCVESIYQMDSVQEALPELAEAVCTVVGYADVED